ncbi:hypothetical protein RI103_02375 [Paraburkholderia sp. FT54]|uniref:hypothetical protein n=1 Tax=Paraburkholderia sp. FT54 TaxID=3074437 RepID=UPI00287736DA|nr:hypothetical protein [Paraburkholderia sp. FT54]WNC90227.1 hypothetical protein RI103_02375 [Paraburkholderia sp. FT54]
MELYQVDIPPPRDWQELQRIATDFYIHKYPDCIVTSYGRPGQKQYGVDTYIYTDSIHIGVQCKRVVEFSVDDLEDEVEKTKAFPQNLDRYVVIPTVPNDTHLINAAARLSKERGFLIEVYFWDEFSQAVAAVEELAAKHFKFAYKVFVEADASSALIELNSRFSCVRFVVTKMVALDKRGDNKNLLLVTSLQAAMKATFHTLGGGSWTDFNGVTGAGAIDAYATWRWISKFKSFESIMCASGEKSEIFISEEERDEFLESLGSDYWT